MKRNLLFLFILIMLFTSCTKEDKLIDISSIEPVYKYDGSDDIEIDSKYKVIFEISDNYFVVSKEHHKQNFMDINGNLLLDKFYRNVFRFSDGLAPVIEEDLKKCYYIDVNGKIVIDTVDGSEIRYSNPFRNGLAEIPLKNRSYNVKDFVIIDTKGNIVEDYKLYLENAFINKKNEIIYDKGKEINEILGKNSNKKLEEISLKLEHDAGENDVIFYSVGERVGLYDRKKDELITQPKYIDYIDKFVNKKVYVLKMKRNYDADLILIDETGKELKKINNYGKLKLTEEKPLDFPSRASYGISFTVNDDKIVANFDKASVVLDMDGNEVLKSKYRNLLSVEENGMISFYDEKTGKYGLINLNDELILKGYDMISNVCNNAVLLEKDGKIVIHKFKN